MGLSTAVSRWGLAIVLLTAPAAVRGEVVDITGEVRTENGKIVGNRLYLLT